jgi:hypothetical protein
MPMPVSKWPSDAHETTDAADAAPAGQAAGQLAAAHASLRHEAKRLLGELREATSSLGDAFAAAGFAPGAWRSPAASLPTLNDQMPNVRLEALLTRLAEFAADTGPHWLASDGAALVAFAREVRVLAATIRPLRALAQRQRVTPPSARGPRPLEHALADGRVGTQLDRLADTLNQLTELAPLLEAPPPSPSAARSGHEPAPRDVSGLPSSEHEHGSRAPDWLVRLRERHAEAPDAPSDSGKAPRWAGSGLLGRVWPRRHVRIVALGLVAGLLVLVVSGALALTHARRLPGGTGSLTSAQALATATHRRSGTPSPARTAVPPTPVPGPAHLAVSPASVVLPCSGATLTVSDTGGQALTWHASVSGSAVLSATSGWVGPHSSGTLGAHSQGQPQHGPGAIVFTSNGGTATVTYKVSCH